MRGIVWTGELEVRDDVSVRAPGPREVAVRVHRAGLCHSDVSVVNGTIPFPTPVVMGHEGAGVVEEVGPAVSDVGPGDHVVLTTLGNCGRCAACDRGEPTLCRASLGVRADRFTLDGAPAYQFANAGVFAERTVVHESQAVVIDPDVPLDAACLIGCAVLTGAGAVLNRAQVRPGDTVLVVGAGGIGQSVVQAARIAAAGRIVVVDANPAKEETARRFGATDFVDASAVADVPAAVRDLGLPDGVDHAFECVGHPSLIRQAVDLLAWGGTCVLLGVPPRDAEAAFQVASLYQNKSILGCRYGAARPQHDIPLLVGLYRAGRFDLDAMVSRVYDLAGIGAAIDDLAGGRLNRGVLALA
ncbi:zinc-binding dehydrogenase [Actinomadura decatromicini]|uniref:Alcohol dehydrogenase catalytic domain-containing protein n=1 Tax=Actinomadura decatromicini TaxID=2604572 RepID=A0A5D3F908_9ACTN|nr:zinc-binding dehydrogenase [Actinomadura decatromicini]TYK44438.1 alcohol dehydrogenase catalytic domain-containing protein [Actinomadura decatromicini]